MIDTDKFWYSLGVFMIGLAIYFVVDQSIIFYLVERLFSPDSQLTPFGRQRVREFLYLLCAWMFLIGLLSFELGNTKNRQAVALRVFSDRIGTRVITQPKMIIVLMLSIYAPIFVLGFFNFYTALSFPKLFKEDALFESLTAIIFIASSVIFFFAAYRSKTSDDNWASGRKRYLVMLNLLTGLLFFGIGMEEINWGQRIFNIRTPSYIPKNYQAEINIHNYFNPYKVVINQVVSSLGTLLLLLGWFRKLCFKSWFFDYYFPHGSLIFLSFMLVPVGGLMEHEMFEELVAVLVGFYSYRTYRVYATMNA